MSSQAIKNRTRLTFVGLSVLILVFWLINHAKAIIGPGSGAGAGSGIIQIDSNRNLSFGTSSVTIGNPTTTPNHAFRVISSTSSAFFVVQSDGRISVGTETPPPGSVPAGTGPYNFYVKDGIMTRNILLNNLTANGTVAAYTLNAISNFTGNINASQVIAGTFNNSAPATFAFPGNLNIHTTSTLGSQALSVYGDTYIQGALQAGTSTFTGQIQTDVSGIRFSDGTVQTTKTNPGTGVPSYIARWDPSTGTQLTTSTIYQMFNGNIGIGTFNANSFLSISGNVAVGAYASSAVAAPTNGMAISGNVGIGTSTLSSTPGNTKVEIVGGGYQSLFANSTDTTGTGISFRNRSAGGGRWYSVLSGGTNAGASGDMAGKFGIYDDTSAVYRLSIDSTGDVGIGTNTAVNKLDVDGSVAIGATYAGSSVAPTNGLLVEGSVGVGTTAPKGKLDVAGGVAVGSYAGVNTPPANSLIVSGNISIGTAASTSTLEAYNPSWPNAFRLSSMSPSGGYIAVDLFIVGGSSLSASGTGLCVNKGASGAKSICLAAWLSDGTPATCSTITTFSRVLCTRFGN